MHKNLFDQIGVGVVVKDGDSLFINDLGEKITGLSSDNLRLEMWNSFLTLNEELGEAIKRSEDSGRIVYTMIENLKSLNGDSTPVEVRVVPFDRGYSVTLIDVPDFLEFKSSWERKLKEIEIMALGLSHEIKNPLGSIRGAAQLLQSGSISQEKRRKYSGIIMEEVDRIDRLIGELLKFSTPIRPEKRVVNIYEILDSVLSRLDGVLKSKEIEIVMDYDPSIDEIMSDGELISRILFNLITNAIDASEKGAKIILRTRSELKAIRSGRKRKKLISIEIEDFGHGLTDEEMERLFTPFFTKKAKGTGLGLVISQRFAHALGGSISASRKEKGLIFKLTLPVE